jgi:hypothetical protein
LNLGVALAARAVLEVAGLAGGAPGQADGAAALLPQQQPRRRRLAAPLHQPPPARPATVIWQFYYAHILYPDEDNALPISRKNIKRQKDVCEKNIFL